MIVSMSVLRIPSSRREPGAEGTEFSRRSVPYFGGDHRITALFTMFGWRGKLSGHRHRSTGGGVDVRTELSVGCLVEQVGTATDNAHQLSTKGSNLVTMRQLCDRHDLTVGSRGFSACISEMPIPFNNNRLQARTHKTILKEGERLAVRRIGKGNPAVIGCVAPPPHPVPMLTKTQSMRRDDGCSLWGNLYWKFSLLAISCNLELTMK